MYRLKSIRYLTTLALVTAILIIIAFISQFIKIANGKSILQLSDGLFLGLTIFIRGPLMLIAGILYAGIIDLITGGLVFIPVSIIIRILMFVLTYFLYRIITRYVANLLSSLMLLWYVLYAYLLFGPSAAIIELINDAIQIGICYIFSIIISVTLERINIKSNYRIWNDQQFDIYKKMDN
ncbi:hypothetical protein [Spiroplasma eriocheiris]|uniref:Uncharacterized protein n=1 Tax=Spiroplasma eriocheiris TaxID=315358 RepID=A0A0H3XMD2_9MOLU|nr:hypothetical protein [Spiroplasma eriocheiris]AHF57607.1 putative transmembrane protein [Spiroplasma eriocheiris CCTCC M 207170]AKM54062.1 hypothetical protein SERIO_v1c04850 [Spiroplasma eriocheiris]